MDTIVTLSSQAMPAHMPCRLCTGPYAAPVAWYGAMSDKEDYVNCPLFRTLCLVRRMGRGNKCLIRVDGVRTAAFLPTFPRNIHANILMSRSSPTVAFPQHVARIRATLWRSPCESKAKTTTHCGVRSPVHLARTLLYIGQRGHGACRLEDTMTTHRITLYRANGSWTARHTDPVVRRLFGTDTLPTPYTERALPSFVRQAIERLNPACIVEVQS